MFVVVPNPPSQTSSGFFWHPRTQWQHYSRCALLALSSATANSSDQEDLNLGIAAGNARCDSDQTGRIDYTEQLGAVLPVGAGLFAHILHMNVHSSETQTQGSYATFFQWKWLRSTAQSLVLRCCAIGFFHGFFNSSPENRVEIFDFLRGDQEESLKEIPRIGQKGPRMTWQKRHGVTFPSCPFTSFGSWPNMGTPCHVIRKIATLNDFDKLWWYLMYWLQYLQWGKITNQFLFFLRQTSRLVSRWCSWLSKGIYTSFISVPRWVWPWNGWTLFKTCTPYLPLGRTLFFSVDQGSGNAVFQKAFRRVLPIICVCNSTKESQIVPIPSSWCVEIRALISHPMNPTALPISRSKRPHSNLYFGLNRLMAHHKTTRAFCSGQTWVGLTSLFPDFSHHFAVYSAMPFWQHYRNTQMMHEVHLCQMQLYHGVLMLFP